MAMIATARNAFRAALIGKRGISDARSRPWPGARVSRVHGSWHRVCNICGWHGLAFDGFAHSESATCPHCGSIARDRYLYWCWTETVPYDPDQRVLETSPRMDQRYQRRMVAVARYTASDYDLSAHKAMIKLDLQDIAMPDGSLDVVLTPHVLEHVPDTARSLAELYRVLAPGGSVLIMIPMPQGVTAAPTEPEYHGDQTLVYWRFGWDLRDMIEAAGFAVRCLVPQPLIDRIRSGHHDTGLSGSDLDEVDLLSHADPDALTAIATERESRRYGFEPDVHFIVWHALKPGASVPAR